jgi:hypothetical protein
MMGESFQEQNISADADNPSVCAIRQPAAYCNKNPG